MANQLNDFDRLIKETYENHEFPYDASAWDGIENEISATVPSMLGFFKSATTGLAIAGAVFATMLIFSSNTDSGIYSAVEDEEIIGEAVEGTANLEADKHTKMIATEMSDQDELMASDTEGNKDAGENNLVKAQKNLTDAQKTTVTALLAEAKKLNDDGASENKDAPETGLDEDIASVKRGCTGLTIDFDAPSDYGSNARYLWNFGDGFFSDEANPTHVFNKEGIFDVSLSVTGVGSGQISSNVIQAMIEVHEAPEANFELGINSMNGIVLNNTSLSASNAEWIVNGENKGSAASDVVLSVADNTKYEVVLVAENEGNCSDTLSKEIHVIEASNQFPKSYSAAYASDFAPGAIVDNGNVTDFRVYAKSTGEEIFRASGQKGWNGKNKAGETVEKGEYQWVMVVDSKDFVNVYQGAVSVR